MLPSARRTDDIFSQMMKYAAELSTARQATICAA
jgi:hypothetical protein